MNPGEAPPASGLARNRSLVLILLLALALRLAFFVAAEPWNPQVVETRVLIGDAAEYHSLALGLLHDGSFASFGAVRTPVYPLLLALVYALFGAHPWIVLLLQVLVSAATVALVYGIANRFLGQRVALIAAFLYAIEPHSTTYASALLTDVPFTFVFVASMAALLRGLQERRVGWVLLSGALLGLATLLRPITQLFPVVVAVIVLLWAGLKPRFRATAVAGFAVVFVVVLSPWLARNYATYGHASLSSIEGYNMLFYNATYAEVARTGRPVDEVRADFRQQASELGYRGDANPFDNSAIFNRVASQYIFGHLGAYVPRHVLGAVNMFLNLATKDVAHYLHLETTTLPFEFFARPGLVSGVLGFLAVKSLPEIAIGAVVGGYLLMTYVLFLLGGISLLVRKQYAFLAVVVLILLYFSALTGVVGLARYKLPVTPFYLIISSYGLARTLDWRRSRAAARGLSASD